VLKPTGLILLGIGLSVLAPLNLVLLQMYKSMDPFMYYASQAASGFVSWIAIALSALSDVMPPMWRAPSFGLVLAGFSMGFALSPFLAVCLGHLGVSIFALGILVFGFILACTTMPETLSTESSEMAKLKRLTERPVLTTKTEVWRYNLSRPARDLLILNRNKLFRLLSALAFFSGCVSAGDHTLFLYYVEENFGFNDRDVAFLFLLIGLMGIFVQAAVLKPLNSFIGERRVIMIAFLVGALHNFLYGIAQSKRTMFIAASIASLTGMSFPTISAIKANNVVSGLFCNLRDLNYHASFVLTFMQFKLYKKDELEQGKIQGALSSLSSLASAIGPMLLRYVYHTTKNGGGLGKGTMFIFGSGLYLVATFCAWLLPESQANSKLLRDAKKRSSLAKPQLNMDYGSSQ
jgi:DHA1 family tetracycline resistance protein-like MFS transporter